MGYYTQANFEDYFWSKFNKTETCWLWTGRIKTPQNYGTIRKNYKDKYIHRVAFELTYGEIPAGLVVRHRCDVKVCGNPTHLLIGTQADNIKDSVDRNLTPRGERHHLSKLKEGSVDEIRKRFWINNESSGALSREFEVHSGTLLNVVHGRTWSHLPNYIQARVKTQRQTPNMRAPVGYAWCGHCKKYLLIEQFNKNKRMFNGLNNLCKLCKKKSESR